MTDNTENKLDLFRVKLLQVIKNSGKSLQDCSIAMGKTGNPAYLHQFIHRGKKQQLPEQERRLVAEFIGVAPDMLERDKLLSIENIDGLKPQASQKRKIDYTIKPTENDIEKGTMQECRELADMLLKEQKLSSALLPVLATTLYVQWIYNRNERGIDGIEPEDISECMKRTRELIQGNSKL